MAEVKREGFALNGAEATYQKLENDRKPYEDRAEDCAKYTIPSLFPKNSDNASTNYATPYQSVGSRGVNNLAAKLMLALFPMQTWFKLSINEMIAKEMTGNDGDLKTQVEEGLAMVERIMMNYIEANSYRVVLFEAIKQLVISGNSLIYVTDPNEGLTSYNPLKLYRLNKYVVQRDTFGNVLQIITKDSVAYSALPEDVRNNMKAEGEMQPDDNVDVFTHIYLDEESGNYKKYEEIKGEIVSGTEAEYPLDACPYIPIRMVRLDGEAYGRSYCEEYLGDLKSLEMMSKALVEASALAAKVVFLVRPEGITQARRLNQAQNGQFIAGNLEDVRSLQLEKQADLSITKSQADIIEGRLGFAFMLNSAIQRSGERVTAEEIRYMANELETTLGGVYSILSQELQMPIVKVLLKQLQATSKIPDLPQEAIEPAVSTGLEALGRGQDLEKLNMVIGAWAQLAPLAQDPDLNMRNIKQRIASAAGIDVTGILMTLEEKQQQEAQMMQQQAMMSGAQSLGGAAGQMAMQDPAMMQDQMAAMAQNQVGGM